MGLDAAPAPLDARPRDQARPGRDPRFDGLFFTAVTSTGICCRPVCPAPAPRPAYVRDFVTAAAAWRPWRACAVIHLWRASMPVARGSDTEQAA